uniref:Uncharacterized protein n=1 Tax=Rhizophora mucronata TaxID=61149 RepID=A0A2P2Q8T8_RHIMU
MPLLSCLRNFSKKIYQVPETPMISTISRKEASRIMKIALIAVQTHFSND